MNKPLALLFLSFTVVCSAWAEKYDYVRLFAGSGTKDQGTVVADIDYYNTQEFTLYDEVELEEGESAKIVARPFSSYSMTDVRYLVLVNEYGTYAYDTDLRAGNNWYNTQCIVGPGKIYAAWHDGTTKDACITLSIEKEGYNNVEYTKLIFDPNDNLTLYHEEVVPDNSSVHPAGSSWRKYYSGTGLTLNSGDYAQVIGYSPKGAGSLVLNAGDKKINYHYRKQDITSSFSSAYLPVSDNIIVGEGQLYLGSEADPGYDLSEDVKWVDIRIVRASKTGSKTLAWNGTGWASTSDSQLANNSGGSVEYNNLLGWAYFTDTNWVYSYTNLSWYYLHGTSDGLYAWNANLPDSGWFKLN